MDGAGELEEDPFYGAMSDSSTWSTSYSPAIMTVGVGLLIFVAVAGSEKELAASCEGSSGNQVRKILMASR